MLKLRYKFFHPNVTFIRLTAWSGPNQGYVQNPAASMMIMSSGENCSPSNTSSRLLNLAQALFRQNVLLLGTVFPVSSVNVVACVTTNLSAGMNFRLQVAQTLWFFFIFTVNGFLVYTTGLFCFRLDTPDANFPRFGVEVIGVLQANAALHQLHSVLLPLHLWCTQFLHWPHWVWKVKI